MTFRNKLNTLLFYLRPKKVIGVSRAFNCQEWLELSIKSVIDTVDVMLIVQSSQPYLNAKIEFEDMSLIINKIKSDYPSKVVVLERNWYNEEQQFEDLIDYSKYKLKGTHLLFIDSDEIYSKKDAKRLAAMARSWKTFNKAVYVTMYTYFKSIYYRVFPTEPYKPLALFPLVNYLKVNNNFRHLEGVPRTDSNIIMHHFSLVRENDNKIRAKFLTRDSYKRTENWYEKYFLNLDMNMKDFHPIIGNEKQWHSIKKIPQEELPHGVAERFEEWSHE